MADSYPALMELHTLWSEIRKKNPEYLFHQPYSHTWFSLLKGHNTPVVAIWGNTAFAGKSQLQPTFSWLIQLLHYFRGFIFWGRYWIHSFRYSQREKDYYPTHITALSPPLDSWSLFNRLKSAQSFNKSGNSYWINTENVRVGSTSFTVFINFCRQLWFKTILMPNIQPIKKGMSHTSKPV